MTEPKRSSDGVRAERGTTAEIEHVVTTDLIVMRPQSPGQERLYQWIGKIDSAVCDLP